MPTVLATPDLNQARQRVAELEAEVRELRTTTNGHAAGSNGTVGPNLDDAKPSKDLAVDRITNGQGGMPSFKGQLSEAQIEAVATFVSENAGK